MQVKTSASRDVTQRGTVCVQNAEVVPVIRPCTLCYARSPYLPPENPTLYLSNVTLNTELIIVVYALFRYFSIPTTCSTNEKKHIYIYIYIYIYI
jgi:hypothetical protein